MRMWPSRPMMTNGKAAALGPHWQPPVSLLAVPNAALDRVAHDYVRARLFRGVSGRPPRSRQRDPHHARQGHRVSRERQIRRLRRLIQARLDRIEVLKAEAKAMLWDIDEINRTPVESGGERETG